MLSFELTQWQYIHGHLLWTNDGYLLWTNECVCLDINFIICKGNFSDKIRSITETNFPIDCLHSVILHFLVMHSARLISICRPEAAFIYMYTLSYVYVMLIIYCVILKWINYFKSILVHILFFHLLLDLLLESGHYNFWVFKSENRFSNIDSLLDKSRKHILFWR